MMQASDLFRWADGRVRVDRTMLYPPFLSALDDVLNACEARGRRYYAIRGWDSFAAQGELFRLYTDGKGGQAAPPGLSAHQYGLAVDFNLDEDLAKAGLQLPNTPRTAKHFAVLVEEARRRGLVSGADFNDAPHVQWPGFVSAKQLAPLKAAWEGLSGTERNKLQVIWTKVRGAPAS